MGVLTFFEDKFENFMGRVFPVPGNFQPEDLASAVCRTAERCKRCRRGQMWLPHGFEVVFGPDAWHRFSRETKALESRIVESLENMAQTRGYLLEKPFHIAFRPVKFSGTPFRVRVVSSPSTGAQAPKSPLEPAVAGKFQTPDQQFFVVHPKVEDLSFLGQFHEANLFCRQTVSVGRSRGSGGPFDVELDEKSVSGRQAHALIEVRQQKIRIKDHHSSNGVKVNGQKVKAKNLEPGDKIELGRVVLDFDLLCRQKEAPDDKTYILEP